MTPSQINELIRQLADPHNATTVEQALHASGLTGATVEANLKTVIGHIGNKAAQSPNGQLMMALEKLSTVSKSAAQAAQPFLNQLAQRGGEYGVKAVEVLGKLPTPNAIQILEKIANGGYGATQAAYQQLCSLAQTGGALKDSAAQMLQRMGQGTGPFAEEARRFISQNGIQIAGGTGTALVTTAQSSPVTQAVTQTGLVARLNGIGRIVGLTGRAATLAGGATVAAGVTLAGILAYLLAGAIGGMGVNSVQPGSQMSGDHQSQRPPDTGVTGGGYYVVVPQGSKILSVRPAKAVDESALCWGDFLHGGLSRDNVAGWSRKDGPFDTADAATRHAATLVEKGSIRPIPLAEGEGGKIGGEGYTMDSWSSLDMGLLRGLVNGS